MFDGKPQRVAAAIVAVAYVAVQSFQWYVFARLPETTDAAAALLQGPDPFNIARAVAMLLSFFGLAWVFLVVCGVVRRRRPAVAVAAFLGFFVFCLLEIQLRSVELFYVYLELPGRYLAAASQDARADILAAQAAFASVQHAVYFPLGLCWTIGSLVVCFGVQGGRHDWLVRWAFGLNALRLILRQFDVYVLGSLFDELYATLYLPMVFLTFVPLAVWLLLQADMMRMKAHA